MTLIDTHAHYNLPAFAADWEEVLAAAHEAGVDRFLCPAISYESNEEMLRLFGGRGDVWLALGIHPKRAIPRRTPGQGARLLPRLRDIRARLTGEATEVDRLERQLDAVARLIDGNPGKVVAVGEAGLDYSRHPDQFERDVQCALFRAQIEIALDRRLPMVLHVREAHGDALAVLRGYGGTVRGVAHCFVGTRDVTEEYLSLGILLGVGGKVTHSSREGDALREAVASAPADMLVLETDAPFVLPEGLDLRGSDAPDASRLSRNDSTNIPLIAADVARVRGESAEDVARATTENAMRLFWGGE